MPSTVAAMLTAAPDDAAVASTTWNALPPALNAKDFTVLNKNVTLPEPESEPEEECALADPEHE